MAKLRVLLMLHELSLSGAPKVVLDIFSHLADKFELHIFALAEGPLHGRAQALGTVTYIELLNSSVRIKTLADRINHKALKMQINRVFQQWKPDILYVNSVAAFPILQRIDTRDTPIVLHVHELEAVISALTHDCPAFFQNEPSRYIAVSEAVRNALINDFAIDPAKIHLVYECISDSLDQPDLLATPDENRAPFVVGGAGTPNMRKGMTLWLQMAAELVAKAGQDQVRFLWVGVGAGVDGALFRMMTRKMGLENVVEFVPVTSEPMKHFARFDVFAMTSWEDPCPIVVLEAMLLRKPVVCFAGGGGAREEIGDTGIAVDRFSPPDMAEAIYGLMRDGQRRRTLGERARARVLNEFTASVQAPKIEHILRELTSRSGDR